MAELCIPPSTAGFWQGLWDGITLLPSFIADIFFDITVYDSCTTSGLYTGMFVIGIICSVAFGILSWDVAIIAFIACLIAFVVWFVFANIVPIALIVIAAMLVLLYRHQKMRGTHA